MSRTYAEIQDVIEQILQDTGATTYNTTETGYGIEEGLKELARYDPHIVMVTFKIEARTGTATSGTTTNTLEDTTKDHFVATDDDNEKVVYNTTDKTWAVITSYSDTDDVGLSADIMVSGESYKIFNKHCYNNRQIFLGDVGGYLWIDRVEYKCNKQPRSWRNWELYGDVLEIDIDFTPTDEDEVNVYFAKSHILCQLTDWQGEVHTAGTAGDTTMQVKSFFDTDVVEVGDEFYIVGHRTLYTITTGVTLNYQVAAGSEIGFYPPLEAAASGDAVINFTKSTLKPQHEEIFCHLVAGRAAISKGSKFLQQLEAATTALADVNTAIDSMSAHITQAVADIVAGKVELAKTPAIVTSAATAIGKIGTEVTQAVTDLDAGRIEVAKVSAIIGTALASLSKVDAEVLQAIADLDSGRTAAALTPAIITKAETAIGLIQNQINPAIAQFHTGKDLINEVNIGGVNVPTNYANYATIALNNARAYADKARVNLQQATADEGVTRTYAQLAQGDLTSASGYIGEARAYLNQATADESLARTYATQASGVLATARGYLTEAQGYFAQATQDESIARSYASTGAAELGTATAELNRAGGYIREITSRLNIASSFRLYQDWGERKLAKAKIELETLSPPRTKRAYPRD